MTQPLQVFGNAGQTNLRILRIIEPTIKVSINSRASRTVLRSSACTRGPGLQHQPSQLLIARPSTETSARSVLSRARKDSFCHIAGSIPYPSLAACTAANTSAPEEAARGTLTDENRSYLIECYSILLGNA